MRRSKRLRNRLLILLLALVLTMTNVPVVQAADTNPFLDIESDAWYYTFAKYAYDHQLMTGKYINPSNGKIKFDPLANMTRAEFVQVLYSREGKPSVDFKNTFIDVEQSAWYAKAVIWASDNDIVAGMNTADGKRKYDVDGKITREQMVAILYKHAKFNGDTSEGEADLSVFLDDDKLSSWAEKGMKWAVDKGMITGKLGDGGNYIAPTSNATRAEASTMLMRYVEYLDSIQDDPDDPDDDPNDNPDDNPGDNPGDNSGDNPGENPSDNPDDNPSDNPSDNPDDNPSDNPDDNPSDDPEENPSTEDETVHLGEDAEPTPEFIPEVAEPTHASEEEELEELSKLQNGELPKAVCGENGVPIFIDGKFSDKIVKSAADAIEALNDIHHLMGFQNVRQEFAECSSGTLGNDTSTLFYRLQQVYQNVPVYGHQLVIATDKFGEIQTLTGHYYPDLDISTVSTVTMQEAKSKIMDETGCNEVRSDGLCIYEANSEPRLVWKIQTVKADYFVDATSGVVVDSESNSYITTLTGHGKDLFGKEVFFPVYQEDDENSLFYFGDEERKIYLYDYQHKNTGMKANKVAVKENRSEDWSLFSEAISAYENMTIIYDYYSGVLGFNGVNNASMPLCLGVNYREEDAEPYNDAFFCKASSDTAVICLGDFQNYAQALDVIGHEYTHAVSHFIWSPSCMNETGAVDEAYADILGELIQNNKLESIGEDLSATGILRSFSNPRKYHQAQSYSELQKYCDLSGHHDCSCGATADHKCDNGNVHKNSGILNYVAYQMDQNWPVANHSDELIALFFKSMGYLTANATFEDCRYALLAAAKNRNLSQDKVDTITEAFEIGKIASEETEEENPLECHVIGTVKDAKTGDPICEATVMAIPNNKFASKISYTDTEGNYDLPVKQDVYKIYASADGYNTFEIENVDIQSWQDDQYYMETIYLTPEEWDSEQEEVLAEGTVRNAMTGHALDGVTIKFRKGAGNQTGTYVKDSEGEIISLETDKTGKYRTMKLPAGNYTLEASKEGFVTGYLNIVSGVSDVCKKQDITLTPILDANSYRIVLTWGQDPEDLDAHLYGHLSNGEEFDTYFNNRTASEGEEEICSLDADAMFGKGPETITLNPAEHIVYYFYVHRFRGSGTLATSHAQVKIYQKEELLTTFNVPINQGEGTYWNVFAVEDGEITLGNTITLTPDLEYAQ